MFVNLFADKSFLVIDDFADMRNMLKSIIRTLGATDIDSASNGKGAIEAIENKKYDIILCDYNLGPGQDGQQVLEEARYRRLISMSTIFVMVTAENTRLMVMGAIEFEPDAYLSKPFSKDLIKARLEKVMARKADLREVFDAVDRERLEQAITLLDQKIAQKPKGVGELMRVKADLCLQAGKYDCSSEIYERILVMRDVPWAKLGLGKVLYGSKKYGESSEIFRELMDSNPDLTVAMDWLARSYQMLGDVDDAKAAIQSAIDLSPKAILRQQMLGDLNMQTGDLEAAEKAYNETVKLGRNSVHNHPSMFAKLARSQTGLGKNDAAMKSVQQISKVFEKDKDAEFYTSSSEALVYHNQGDAEKSKAAMDRASKLYERSGSHDNNDVTLELARIASQVGDTEKAKALLTAAIQNNHDDEEFLQSITATLDEAGLADNPVDFVADLKKEVVEMNNRGVKLLQKGELSMAVDVFREAGERMPSNRIINVNAARAMLMMMEKNGAKTEALGQIRKYLERLKKIDPNDSTLKSLLSRLQKVVTSS